MKTILFLMSGYSQAEKKGRDEILRFARSRKWRVQCVPYAQAEASGCQRRCANGRPCGTTTECCKC